MKERKYSKLLINSNQENGDSKLRLGYTASSNEKVFLKDKETYFHVPYNSKSVLLKDSTFISCGATGGAIPFLSDRIKKSFKNYGNATPNGTPVSGIVNGMWYYSWLKKDENGNLQWMDRLFNSGNIQISDITNSFYAETNKNLFIDVPSTMTLDPGVRYSYFHVGETTSKNFVDTFAGSNGERLLLQLNNWVEGENIDTSPKNIQVKVTSAASLNEIKELGQNFNAVPFTCANFDPSENTRLSLQDESINVKRDFSIGFWASSKNWEKQQNAQLFGNYTTKEGLGVFIETLNEYPFFVIPENYYKSLFLINQDGTRIANKLNLFNKQFLNPQRIKHVAINNSGHVFVTTDDNSGTICKINSAGDVLISTKNISIKNEFNDSECNFPNISEFCYLPDEFAKGLFCLNSNKIMVVTNKQKYIFDENLNLLTKEKFFVPPSDKSIPAIKWNNLTKDVDLLFVENATNVKFFGTDQWTINSSDKFLYKNSIKVNPTSIKNCSDLHIGPDSNVWVLHGNNYVSKLNPNNSTILQTFAVGNDVPSEYRWFSFLKTYDNITDTTEWISVIFNSADRVVYYSNLTGNVINFVEVDTYNNFKTLVDKQQNVELTQYKVLGDFTGYEHKQFLFAVYGEDYPRIALRGNLFDSTKQNYYTFNQSVSIKDWIPESWHHVFVTCNANVFTLYVDAVKHGEVKFERFVELNYFNQPAYYIGSTASVNEVLKKPLELFDGKIADIKMYDYSLDSKKIECFLRSFYKAENLNWLFSTYKTPYIEEIERIFKNKIPGSKSLFYEINLSGIGITDERQKALIENQIRRICKEMAPAHCELIKINWSTPKEYEISTFWFDDETWYDEEIWNDFLIYKY